MSAAMVVRTATRATAARVAAAAVPVVELTPDTRAAQVERVFLAVDVQREGSAEELPRLATFVGSVMQAMVAMAAAEGQAVE